MELADLPEVMGYRRLRIIFLPHSMYGARASHDANTSDFFRG